ncbi:unnamed protein product [Fusarium graminearum]|uniref:Uncharacterized protein n=1 Tax=Gibberella zeae TaxID=5518 RepID=A0A4U9EX75_GIBZA|nr:hypothetical protein FG05_02902 [Fusarium graminearum]KAI6771708.1 hypothetical protein HG531_009333 [Fusarium graminearum]CAF3456862.1 unnamed protein product [Fusarium graminearum]CAF3472869.1 unnamed protein product [Fusarium graminearum]CAG1960240.1 unnamed protein product [Fusarium graminearum]
MLESSISFIKSSVPVYHNAVKSIIFKCAELLMGIFIYKLFSLIAARSNQFTSYLMFTEDYIQRTLYISSRGLSRAGLVVLAFSLLNIVLSLYGTLLWALDAPGYIFKATEATIADYADQRNDNPPYIVQMSLDPSTIDDTTQRLSQIIGSDLFHPGLNYTLTGKVSNKNGAPEVVPQTGPTNSGARIWLDDDGLSVSIDVSLIYSANPSLDDESYVVNTTTGSDYNVWENTFDNVFSTEFIATVAGKPEVHWDTASDRIADSRYILPNRYDNIWFSFGGGGGSGLMNQVFTVTKGKRRHTFFQSTFKTTMLTTAGVDVAKEEVSDLVERAGHLDQDDKMLLSSGRIVDNMMNAQRKNMSYHYGLNTVSNNKRSTLQNTWGFYTLTSNGRSMFSLIRITSTNMTLIRSENISKAPEPQEKCQLANSQDEAYGGQPGRSDCFGHEAVDDPRFFGLVDTAAVMVAHDLGDGRSNLSSESLDNNALTWIRDNAHTMESLLVSRAYSVGIDPSLVYISVEKLIVAVSYLQLALSCLALLMAIVLWLALMIFADAHWASSLLANLIHTTTETGGAKPGYMMRDPSVTLQPMGKRKLLAVKGGQVTLCSPPSVYGEQTTGYVDETKNHMTAEGYPVNYVQPHNGEERLMAGYEQPQA